MVGLKRSTVCQLYIHITLCRKEEVGSGGDSSSDDWRSLVVNETSHLSHDCGHWFAILLPINSALTANHTNCSETNTLITVKASSMKLLWLKFAFLENLYHAYVWYITPLMTVMGLPLHTEHTLISLLNSTRNNTQSGNKLSSFPILHAPPTSGPTHMSPPTCICLFPIWR